MVKNSEINSQKMVIRTQRSFSHWGMFLGVYFLDSDSEDEFCNPAWQLKYLTPIKYKEIE